VAVGKRVFVYAGSGVIVGMGVLVGSGVGDTVDVEVGIDAAVWVKGNQA